MFQNAEYLDGDFAVSPGLMCLCIWSCIMFCAFVEGSPWCLEWWVTEVHLILSWQLCSSGLIRLFPIPRCLSLCLPHCLYLGFPWDFTYRVWRSLNYYLLFTILEPCWGAVQGPSSLALWLGSSLLVDCSWVFSCPCYELEKTSVEYFSSLRLFRSWESLSKYVRWVDVSLWKQALAFFSMVIFHFLLWRS